MLVSFPSIVAALSLLPGAPPEAVGYGYLWHYVPDGRGHVHKVVTPYNPQEGDLVFYDDQSKIWTLFFALARTAPPFHAGIVVKKPEGTLALLEAGPDEKPRVYLLEACRRLHTFNGIVQIRCCRQALTLEQSARLTGFALAQQGKAYATGRLLMQLTPFKGRGPLRERLFAETSFDRKRWICAELVVSAAELVGLMDATVIKASNTYPLDLVNDRKHKLSPVYDEAGYWTPQP